jgi:flagellar P-ring protein precursor FlgI
VNHPTVGRIPNGGLVERDSALDLSKLQHLSLLLNEESFTTVEEVATVINGELGNREAANPTLGNRRAGNDDPVGRDSASHNPGNLDKAYGEAPAATVIDGRRVEIKLAAAGGDVPALLARIENLEIRVQRKAKVVVNERTGTVVLGKDVRLGAVSILHGSFSVEVSTTYSASQPNALGGGQTEVVPETRLKATEGAARNVVLNEGARVEELVTRLQAIGATARDVVSILQAIKAAGALEAELEII